MPHAALKFGRWAPHHAGQPDARRHRRRRGRSQQAGQHEGSGEDSERNQKASRRGRPADPQAPHPQSSAGIGRVTPTAPEAGPPL